jgi:uncharacterized membrane protein
MSIINQILNACRPLVQFVSLLFGVIAAYKGLLEVVPVLGQIVPITMRGGSAQSMAIVAGALALVAGRS